MGIEQRLNVSWDEDGLRARGEPFWADFVGRAGATILSSIKNDQVTAYLLSESSLFVWEKRALMITCGQMTPLSSSVLHPFKVETGPSVFQMEFDHWGPEAHEVFGSKRSPGQYRAFLGLDRYFPGYLLDDHAFTPFGYSLNAIHGGQYYTVHVSPEINGGYISFETNADVNQALFQHWRELFTPESPSFASP